MNPSERGLDPQTQSKAPNPPPEISVRIADPSDEEVSQSAAILHRELRARGIIASLHEAGSRGDEEPSNEIEIRVSAADLASGLVELRSKTASARKIRIEDAVDTIGEMMK